MSLDDRLAEFEASIWDHSEDEFQIAFDTRAPLAPKELSALAELIRTFSTLDEADLAAYLRRQIQALGENHFFLLLQLAGLTRNKILTDLRASTAGGRTTVRMPSSHWAILNSDPAWAIAGSYLIRKLRPVVQQLTGYEDPRPAIEAVNQATWPGFIRQERAKRQGHEAEGRLAQILAALRLPFVPEGKAENPMCPDATINGVSFDLVIPSIHDPRICVKSTVHTSNIGQFGESKDHLEVDEAKRMLDSSFPRGHRPTLLALIDGIGFRSNRAGLEGVLSKADEFCQFKTLWKASVIGGHALGLPLVLALPPAARAYHSAFLTRFASSVLSVVDLSSSHAGKDWVPAGEGFLQRL